MMSEHALPDNMEEWPANPYDLFGVDYEVSERELRKAYHKLIKLFRPEHAPEQFRKLNEAYESLRVQVRYDEQYRRQEETDDNEVDEDWMAGTSWRTDESPVDTVSPVDRQRAQLWELALEGELHSAAEQFESLCDEYPEDEESLLRLYWLKRLTREQIPLDRMERFLNARGPACRCFAMYLLELERDSSICRRSSSRELLLSTVIRHETTQLAQSSWLQLIRQKQFIRVGHDLDDLKQELVYDHPSLWTLIVHQAAELLALNKTSPQHPLMQRVRSEIRECEPAHENEWVETRWSLVHSLMFERAPNVTVPERLVDLISDSMLGEVWDHRYRLERIAEPWIDSPLSGLSVLDRLKKYAASAVYLLHRFAEKLLDDRDQSLDQKFFDHLLPRLIEFGETQSPHSYQGLRERLAHFCRVEDVDLDLFINGILNLEQRGRSFPILNDDVIAELNNDWPLRCLISCVRLFNE